MEEYNITPSGQDEKTYNAVISRYLYSWIFTGDTVPNILIDEKVIDTAIKESIVCRGDQSDDVCYFMFRNKYRNIDPADAEEISSQLTANCFASGSKNTLDLS